MFVDQVGIDVYKQDLFLRSTHLPFQSMKKEPEVVTVTLKKHNGMGLSIVAAKVVCVCVCVLREKVSGNGLCMAR